MGNGQSNEAVDEEEPGPTQIPSSAVLGVSGEDVAYQEIVTDLPQEADGMEPFRRAVGMDVTGGSPAAGAVARGSGVTTGAQRGAASVINGATTTGLGQLRDLSDAATSSTGGQVQQLATTRGEQWEDSGIGADSLTTSRRSLRPRHDPGDDTPQRFYTPDNRLFELPAAVGPPSGDYYTAPRPSSAALSTNYGAADDGRGAV